MARKVKALENRNFDVRAVRIAIELSSSESDSSSEREASRDTDARLSDLSW